MEKRRVLIKEINSRRTNLQIITMKKKRKCTMKAIWTQSLEIKTWSWASRTYMCMRKHRLSLIY